MILERFTKSAALGAALAIVVLQIASHPDLTWMLRALVSLAVIVGWLGAGRPGESVQTFWVFTAAVAPAALRTLTGREGPVLDLVWMAGLAFSLLRVSSWSEWSLPRWWRVLLGGWALTLALAWPVLAGRETGFDPSLFGDTAAVNSWALLSAPQVVGWTLHVTLTQLLGVLWLDWLLADTTRRAARLRKVAIAMVAGVSVASLVAVYQGTTDLQFLSTPGWAALKRATGTLLDANAFGVVAALAAPLTWLAAVGATRIGVRASGGILALNLAGMWLSGSRTALLCGAMGIAGLSFGWWTARDATGRRRLAWLAVGVAAIVSTIVMSGAAVGPLERFREMPTDASDVAAALWNRGGYGLIGAQMIGEYPLTGVGIGGYHVMAPDYWRVIADDQLPFDNAQNWWRHQAAELGFLGGFAVVLWSALFGWESMTRRLAPEQRLAGWTLRGLIAGLAACSLLGVPTQSPLVLLWFFLLAAWFAVISEGADRGEAGSRSERKAWAVVAVLAVSYVGMHGVLGIGSLSVAARAARVSREYIVGTYPPEPMPDGGEFRWTTERARFVWPTESQWLVIRLWAQHPDIAKRPVNVTLRTSCGVLLMDRALNSGAPVTLGIDLGPQSRVAELQLEVDRTWRPAAYGATDMRDLGVAIVHEFAPSAAEAGAQQAMVAAPPCQAGLRN